MSDLTGYYKAISPHYDSLRVDGHEEIELFVSIVTQILSGRELTGKLGLEIGCGTARYIARLQDVFGLKAVGVDRSESQLEAAPEGVLLIEADAARLPLRAAQFDIALCILMLQQNTPSEQNLIIGEARRVLKKGGLFITKTTSHEQLKRRSLLEYFPSMTNVNINRYPDVGDIHQMLEASDFQIVSTHVTETIRKYTAPEIIAIVEQKHNSTLHLISDSEFESGLNKMRVHLSEETGWVEINNLHTIIIAEAA